MTQDEPVTKEPTAAVMIREGSAVMRIPDDAQQDTMQQNATKASKDDLDNANSTEPPLKRQKKQHEQAAQIQLQRQAVFYNPVQVQNRDLSVLMLTVFAEHVARQEATRYHRQYLSKRPDQQPELRLRGPELEHSMQEFEREHKNDDAFQLLRERKQLWQQVLQQQHGKSQPPQQGNVNGSTSAVQSIPTAAGNAVIDESDTSLMNWSLLEALAASGLRSVRYWKELPPGVLRHVTINDWDAVAVQQAEQNVRDNGLQDHLIVETDATTADASQHQRPVGIQVQQGDALYVLSSSRRPQAAPMPPMAAHMPRKPRYNVIDLDPYGSVVPYLDAAVQAVEHGGLLCITSTDMAALGGSHPDTCFGRYASMPISRAGYLQELALRIVLNSVAVSAARYGRTIHPILSVGMDFYVRLFVQVLDSKAAVNQRSLQTGLVLQSTQCPSFYVVPQGQSSAKNPNVIQPGRMPPGLLQCTETGAGFKVAGPIWIGPLHDRSLVQAAVDKLSRANSAGSYPNLEWIKTRDRLLGLLSNVMEELPDVPLFYKLSDLVQTLRITSPPLLKIKAALHHAGYAVSGYHKDPIAIKTSAPPTVIWDIIRLWIRQHESDQDKITKKKSRLPEDSAGAKILLQEPTTLTEANFAIPMEWRKGGKVAVSVPRFPQNPQAYWGPKPKAVGAHRHVIATKQHEECNDTKT